MERKYRFLHVRLDVYRITVRFVIWTERLPEECFRRRADRKAQLARAADSILLNIAEGASLRGSKSRQNHHRIALGSAGECDAILELLEIRGFSVNEGREWLSRIGAMLCRMI